VLGVHCVGKGLIVCAYFIARREEQGMTVTNVVFRSGFVFMEAGENTLVEYGVQNREAIGEGMVA